MRPLAAPDVPLPPTSPTHYDPENWENLIPASESGRTQRAGDGASTQGPGAVAVAGVTAKASAQGPAFQVLLQKWPLLERRAFRYCPCFGAKSAGVPNSETGREGELSDLH